MTFAIDAISPVLFVKGENSLISTVLDKATQMFLSIHETLFLQNQRDISTKKFVNLSALYARPHEIFEGCIWGGFCALNTWLVAGSAFDLYAEVTVENTWAEKFETIGSLAKRAFVDLVSLGSSFGYMAQWAHEAEVISLGQFLPCVKTLCFGASLSINLVESGADIYNIWFQTKEISEEINPKKQGESKKTLYFYILKLIGDVSMVAFAALEITIITGGLAISPYAATAFLIVGCVFSIGSIFYKTHCIEEKRACLLHE